MYTKGRRQIEPSPSLRSRILCEGLELEELFCDGRSRDNAPLDHLRQVARLKTVGVFRAADKHSFLGMNGSLDQLVMAIAEAMQRPHDFVEVSDLPRQYRDLTGYWLGMLRVQAHYLLLMEVVVELNAAGTQLWYFQGGRCWQASQSLLDEYDELLRKTKGWRKPRRSALLDQRNWHGRPKRDRKNGTREGVSTGGGTT